VFLPKNVTSDAYAHFFQLEHSFLRLLKFLFLQWLLPLTWLNWLPKLPHFGGAGVVPILKVRAPAMWL
jgi:hypothetical protein